MKWKIIFLVFLLLLAGFLFWDWQSNNFSKDVVKLEIIGPDKASLAQEVEYTVRYKNNGNIRLDNPRLTFVPPSDSLEEGKMAERKVLDSEKLGLAIYPGEEKSFTFKVRIFGKEGETKTARAFLDYQPKGLKASYESTTSLTTVIKSVPLTFDFDLPSRVSIGRKFTLDINYFSSIDYPLTDLLCRLQYPDNFEFLDSQPSSPTKTDWQIPLLNKADGGRIEISGRLSGKVGEVSLFKAQLGIFKNGRFIVLKEIEKGVELTKPSLLIREQINGNPQYVAKPGDWLHYEIFFRNIGENDLNNLTLISKLEGEAFDFQTIKSDAGSYQAGDNSLIFDWRKIPALQHLAPTEEGKVDFWIKLKDRLEGLKNPSLKNTVFIGYAREEFLTKVSGSLLLSQKGYFQDEVFGNSGPLPPKVGSQTTYTIIWRVEAPSAPLKNVIVKAKLPSNVKLTGAIFPDEEKTKFSFDSKSGEISWMAGNLGETATTTAKSLAFQVTLTPTKDEKGGAATIIGEATGQGDDVWAGKEVVSSSPPVTTILPDDPTVNENMGIIQ